MGCNWCQPVDTDGPRCRPVAEGRSFRLVLDADGTPVLLSRRHVELAGLYDAEWQELRRHLATLTTLLVSLRSTGTADVAVRPSGHFQVRFEHCHSDGSAAAAAEIGGLLGENLGPAGKNRPYVPDRRVRPVAMCVFLDGDRMLVVDGGGFLRPPAGEIEFGEVSAEAVRREMSEEVGIEGRPYELLGILENVFNDVGGPGHEIVFVFDGNAAGVDTAVAYRANEVHSGERPAFWAPVRQLRLDPRPVYPGGLLDLVESHVRAASGSS